MLLPRGEIVLVVDDEVLIQFMLEDALNEEGYEVRVAGNAREALEVLAAEPRPLSALITDIRLGVGATGWEIAEQARLLRPGIPILYVSGDSREEFATRGVAGSELVTKPFLAEDVVSLLRMLAARKEAEGGL